MSRLLADALKNGIEYTIHTLFSSVEIIPVLLWLYFVLFFVFLFVCFVLFLLVRFYVMLFVCFFS